MANITWFHSFLKGLTLTLAAAALVITPIAVFGQVVCNDDMGQNEDSDLDGFSDYHECYGLKVNFGDGIYQGSVNGSNLDRSMRLDPNSPDLFVILVRANDEGGASTNIPRENGYDYFDPFEFVSNPQNPNGPGGLGIAVHVIPYDAENPIINDRKVSPDSPQLAIRVTESLRTDVEEVGSSFPGTPNDRDRATIYTARIWEKLKSACACIGGIDPNCEPKCKDASFEIYGYDLYPFYIQNTIAHEIGHLLGPRTEPFSSRFGGNHTKAGTYVMMEQFIVYTAKKGQPVVFYISKGFSREDQSTFKLQ
jgi:hypothetical protein